ncbi:MAG: hypothetical protein WC981_04085 [Candidatus Dojkabacteria bacterium]
MSNTIIKEHKESIDDMYKDKSIVYETERYFIREVEEDLFFNKFIIEFKTVQAISQGGETLEEAKELAEELYELLYSIED